MQHRLALAFGCTRAELMHRMRYSELDSWSEYYVREPWGFEIENVRHAQIVQAIVASSMKGKRAPPVESFMYKHEPLPMDQETRNTQIKALFKSLGAK